jgi:hypothetical protein
MWGGSRKSPEASEARFYESVTMAPHLLDNPFVGRTGYRSEIYTLAVC